MYSIAHNQSHQCFWLRGIYGPAGQWQSLCLENLAKKTWETQLCAMEIPIVRKWTWRLNGRLIIYCFLTSDYSQLSTRSLCQIFCGSDIKIWNLKITWKKWNKEHQTLSFQFFINKSSILMFFGFFSCGLKDFKF